MGGGGDTLKPLRFSHAVLALPGVQNDAVIETIEGPVEIAEEESYVEQDESGPLSQAHTSVRDSLSMKSEDGEGNKEDGYGSVDDLEISQRSQQSMYKEILQSYNGLEVCSESLNHAKRQILSYSPGAFIYKAGGMELSDYATPRTTSLLLIGPKGSGKSSLINKISRVLEKDHFISERAQVSYNSSTVDGTFFLQEYMVPKNSTSFSLYDTRSLSDDSCENLQILERWMTKGVRNGELVLRESDSSSLKARMKCKTRLNCSPSIELRMINFVVFVVNGLSVLKSVDGDDPKNGYSETIVTSFNSPYLSFRDDKPVVVVTHGDLLTLSDRARIRVHLGELLGIPPAKQVFDIPESSDSVTKMAILDMLSYCLEHADKNIPPKRWRNKAAFANILKWLAMIMIVGIAICLHYFCFSRSSPIIHAPDCFDMHPTMLEPDHIRATSETVDELKIDWHSIRHLWFDM